MAAFQLSGDGPWQPTVRPDLTQFRYFFLDRCSGGLSFPLAVEQTTDVHITQDVDGRSTAVEEPIDGQEHRDVFGG